MKILKTKADIKEFLLALGWQWPKEFDYAVVSPDMKVVYLSYTKPKRINKEWKDIKATDLLDLNGQVVSATGHHTCIFHYSEYGPRVLVEDTVPFDLKVARAYVNKVKSSKERGLAFELSLQFFLDLFKSPVCAYTGIKLTIPNEGIQKPTDLTLERIDPLVGYTETNTIVVSQYANSVKATLDSFLHSKLSDEAKRKILSQALYRVNKRIKHEKADNAGANGPVNVG